MADLGVTLELFSNVDSVIDHGVQVEGTGASAAATPAGGEHLDKNSVSIDLIVVLWKIFVFINLIVVL
jgi:hypothetical protein